MKEIRLGRLGGLEFSAMPSAFLGALVVWLALCAIAIGALNLPPGEAIVGALLATALYWISDTVHQFGHARAARQTGHPMLGVRYWGVLSSSLYPANEEPLPAAVHVRRALGGPIMSAVVTIFAAALVYIMRFASVYGTPRWIALFLLLVNLLVFTLGAFLPLGFTDGSTLLRWRNKP